MADRGKRMKSLIERNVSEILMFEIKNPKIGFVTVNEVRMNADNSIAKIYVSFLGAKYPHQNFQELLKVKGVVRSSLSKKLDVYKVPNLQFIYDDSAEKAERMDALLKKEADDIEKAKKGQQ